MVGEMLRSLGVAVSLLIATVGGAGEVKTVLAETKWLNTESWIMGGSGLPIPPPGYLDAVSERFIDPAVPFFAGQPQFLVDATNPLFTPEGLYPNSGVKSLELDPSQAQGLSILNSTITNQITDGNHLVVLGYSQSATISSLEMGNLLALPTADQPTANQLSFVLLGDPSNPNGGLFERFYFPFGGSAPAIPSLGITFSGATPAATPWETAIYTLEYDGYADFPRYPINLLSDLNAVLGVQYEHTVYPALTDAQLASAVELPVSADYTGNTHYFMIPSETLPLLAPLQSLPVIGQPLYDLLEPDMRILVNLGYGSITDGWASGPADVPTTYGLFPDVNPTEVLTALAGGTAQGIHNLIANLGSPSVPDVLPGLTGGIGDTGYSLPSLIDVVNTLSGAAATAYATLLPTADIVNALVTTALAYAVSMFLAELASGNVVDAVGMPVAGMFGLGSIAAGFEFLVMLLAGSSIASDLQGLLPS